jgi:hypothetical protein
VRDRVSGGIQPAFFRAADTQHTTRAILLSKLSTFIQAFLLSKLGLFEIVLDELF